MIDAEQRLTLQKTDEWLLAMVMDHGSAALREEMQAWLTSCGWRYVDGGCGFGFLVETDALEDEPETVP